MKKLDTLVFTIGLLLVLIVPILTNNNPVEVLSIRKAPFEDTTIVPKVDGDTTAVPRAADGIVNKYAVIVGISDYKAISDLLFCDEDATDWFYQLNAMGYVITLLGDHSNSYPQHDGLATEYNLKVTIGYYLSIADEDDIVVFASSGHGAGTRGRPDSRKQYLCMWDCSSGENGEDGSLYDFELKDLYANAVCKWFISLDHCYSGGMNEIMSNTNAANGYLVTTCTASGYGYDVPAYINGAWTYFFLEFSWQGYFGGSPDVAMEDVFAYAAANYPYDNKDMCMEFDGSTSFFYL